MRKEIVLLAAIAVALAAGAQTQPVTHKGQDSVEAVRVRWVAEFQKDPPGKVEVFHCGGQKTIKGQENYLIGMTEAAFETGHPIYFTQGEEEPFPVRK
jgi:hypothetical protein